MATAINDSGQVVGNVYNQNSGQQYDRFFLYSGGSMQILPLRPGTNVAEAKAINGSGQVAGWDEEQIGWNPISIVISGGTPQVVGPPVIPNANAGGDEGAAFGINDSGQVVGHWTSNHVQQGFIDTGGTMQYLGDAFGGNISEADAINNKGQVVGMASNTGNHNYLAFLFSNGSMRSIGALSGYPSSYANDINESGLIVGTAASISGNRAFLDQNLVMTDLNSLISSSSGWTLEDATGVNDAGQICGSGINPSGQYRAFLLTPTPEPSTLTLAGCGAAALVSYRWRRRCERAGEKGNTSNYSHQNGTHPLYLRPLDISPRS